MKLSYRTYRSLSTRFSNYFLRVGAFCRLVLLTPEINQATFRAAGEGSRTLIHMGKTMYVPLLHHTRTDFCETSEALSEQIPIYQLVSDLSTIILNQFLRHSGKLVHRLFVQVHHLPFSCQMQVLSSLKTTA